ncbi:MAG: MBOAT family O-acyltransferase [Lachnospiraceae bacterium]|nr:MBOAT family O-acyltransferase [Lachnospiraceae bacterium]
MLFNSMVFLWVFLPIVIAVNFILSVLKFKDESTRIKAKNIFLLIASFVFYAWGGIYYLLIMICTIVIDFYGGIFIDKYADDNRKKKTSLVITIVLNLSILFFFKYFNMVIIIIENVMALGGKGIIESVKYMKGTGALHIMEIVLPIGISFFTFQAMSYVIDIYRSEAKIQKNIFDFALYVSLFPQLIAGPIVQYRDVAEQITGRKESADTFLYGIKRFCYGMGKKVIIANTLAEVADAIWALEIDKLGALVAWLGIIAYTFQIYYDFSGYSDMAIGLGKMLGFSFKENFNYPYTSASVQEFWRRWHISLSSWFRDYVYIPLGGSRQGAWKTYFNVFIVFLLTGVWHGANFTFISWGLMYAVLLIIERMFLKRILEKNPVKFISHIYTLFFVMIGWILFRSDTLLQAKIYIMQLFTKPSGDYTILSYISLKVIIVIILAVLFCGLVQNCLKNTYEKIKNNAVVIVIDYAVQMTLLIVSIVMIVSGTYNAFIYFQF